MAKGIQNYPNIDTSDPINYPNGKSKDDTGSLNGTPVNVVTIGDYQQVFAKMLRSAGIAPNGLPENETNGHQYYSAMRKLFRKFGQRIDFDGSVSSIVSGAFSPLVTISGSGGGGLSLEDSANSNDLDTVMIINTRGSIFALNPSGSDTINGSGSAYNIGANTRVQFTVDKANANWQITG